ncbi:RrF2 family transcriptional regulator [Rugosimonospora africana]|uniref:Rrf2 family transcriptional regulator n=1 Tax=Rugosimonospora africana TaxID=556532 RepID=A0A8J3VQC8_9ACTN|nr:Rrf2 family transcriptional regulator [Rugosimonospora africana]GIH14907.1 Rrf2 family transcriptional regulator [Rugosimonospora africana]
MRVSARGDYAVRAALALAARHPATVSTQALADEQRLPRKFLEAVLADLRRADVVRAVRGCDGGYQLTREPNQVAVATILRAVDGPLAEVRGMRPEEVAYVGCAEHLSELWVAARSALRDVLDEVNLAQLASGRLPSRVRRLAAAPDAWQPR